MRIGIVPRFNPDSGGLHQYELVMLEAIAKLSAKESENTFIMFDGQDSDSSMNKHNEFPWPVESIYPPTLKRKLFKYVKRVHGEKLVKTVWDLFQSQEIRQSGNSNSQIRYKPDINKWFKLIEIDWSLYTAPTSHSFEVGLPYVMPVHDLQHRLQPEFPEVSANGEFERREYLYKNGIQNATIILVDSQVGKDDVLEYYGGPDGINPDQVKILPFLPANYLSNYVSDNDRIRLRETYNLPEHFLFYPAQFWPHKNHSCILQALNILKVAKKLEINVVFCGSYSGDIREKCFKDIMMNANKMGISKQIYYLGYVPDQDMSSLYSEATGLVMPTFFGPTNIPVIEAWSFDCPVITSDIRGVREQAKDAALLVDPKSGESLAEAIYDIFTDENLCNKLIRAGHQKLSSYKSEDYSDRLSKIIHEANEYVSQK